jgi:hypothetical protein
MAARQNGSTCTRTLQALRFSITRRLWSLLPGLRPLAAHGSDDTRQENAQDHEEKHERPEEDTAGDGTL